ncbi:protein L-Myc-1-B-like [Ascaphus truei]|uniref:protein L-Myc-1-B-like n=1 Tax=Ascaphus truei TaxID=8439 RepID=UPI003F5AC281
MEFGSYNNHYFYDVDLEEDFYRSIAPSEDIWKKFELVPNCSLSTLGCPGGGGKDWGTELMDLGWESPVKLPGLSSVVLLRDCMWSGFSTRERLEKVINERLSTGTPRATNAPKPATDSDLLEPVADIPEQSPPALLVPASMTDKIAPSSGSESASDSGERAAWAEPQTGPGKVAFAEAQGCGCITAEPPHKRSTTLCPPQEGIAANLSPSVVAMSHRLQLYSIDGILLLSVTLLVPTFVKPVGCRKFACPTCSTCSVPTQFGAEVWLPPL